MSKFILNIDMNNAALSDEGWNLELGRILRVVAEQVENEDVHMFRTIWDINGNDVGRFAVKPDDYR